MLEPLIMLDLTINSITLDLIKDVFIHTIYQEEVTNAIKIENVLNHIYDDDTHIFIMNFSHGEIAHIYKDDTYLNDKIRKNLKLKLQKILLHLSFVLLKEIGLTIIELKFLH